MNAIIEIKCKNQFTIEYNNFTSSSEKDFSLLIHDESEENLKLRISNFIKNLKFNFIDGNNYSGNQIKEEISLLYDNLNCKEFEKYQSEIFSIIFIKSAK